MNATSTPSSAPVASPITRQERRGYRPRASSTDAAAARSPRARAAARVTKTSKTERVPFDLYAPLTKRERRMAETVIGLLRTRSERERARIIAYLCAREMPRQEKTT